MSEWIQKFEYGNMNIGRPEDLTTYWLNGPLETSASDQINFLTKMVKGELPISALTTQNARKIMVEKQGENWRLYAKTGWRHDGVNTDIGWYVGWLETSVTGRKEIYIFALNMDMNSSEQRNKRKSIALQALGFIGALPASQF